MSHELFLEWLSERGAGRWASLVAAHDWLFNAGKSKSERVETTWTVRTLAELGHVEIDWQRQLWSATPPLLTVLPTAGARSLLSGGRTRTLLRRLEEETAERITDNVQFARRGQRDAPDAIFLVSRDETDIEKLATRLGVVYEYSAADRLSKVLPSLDAYLAASESTPPPAGFEAQRLDPSRLVWSSVATDRTPGLYSYATSGMTRYRFVPSPGTFHAVERAIGIYAELRRVGEQVLHWRADDVNGTLIVPARAPLPNLHARAATACSGLAAKFVQADTTRRYVNVPEQIATRIAQSLGQVPVANPPKGLSSHRA